MRPRSGDEGRKEEATATAAAAPAAAAAARTEIRSRVFCNYPTLLKNDNNIAESVECVWPSVFLPTAVF